ncbi:MAG: hypothetical protein FWD57_11015 [Polyangiaceae bacterium]|nr:hypothetical protein [Polyangiaceae bacterium]
MSYDDAKPRAALVAPSFSIGIGHMPNDAAPRIVQLAPAHRVHAAELPKVNRAMTSEGTTKPPQKKPAKQGLLQYSSNGNRPSGSGWSFSLPRIARNTEKGLPGYLDRRESDVFVFSGAARQSRRRQAGRLVPRASDSLARAMAEAADWPEQAYLVRTNYSGTLGTPLERKLLDWTSDPEERGRLPLAGSLGHRRVVNGAGFEPGGAMHPVFGAMTPFFVYSQPVLFRLRSWGCECRRPAGR